ncbi:MAG: glycosyltransferase family 87 protein [Haloarculaceae archaeon]
MSALSRLWKLRKEHPQFVAVAVVTLVVLAAYPFVDMWLRSIDVASGYRYYDFGAYRNGIDRWHRGETIYQRTESGGFHGTFLYPPIALALFLPFDGMPFAEAAAAWGLFSLALLWVGLQLAASGLGCTLARWERAALLWVLIGFQPLALSMKMGQMAGFMAGLLALSLAALLRGESGEPDRTRSRLGRLLGRGRPDRATDGGRLAGRPGGRRLPRWAGGARLARWASGALTGVVGLVKMSYAPIGAHLLADRDRFLGAVAAGVVMAVASLAVFGPEVNRTYLDVLVWGTTKGTGGRPPTLWLPPYYRPLQWLPAAQALRVVGSLAVAAVAVLSRGRDRSVFALGVAAFPLLTPLGYAYYFVGLVPAVFVLVADELDRDGYPALPVFGLLLVHLHSHGLKFVVSVLPTLFPPVKLFAPYSALQPGLWGNLLLFALAFVRVAQTVPLPAWVPASVTREPDEGA